MAESEIDASRDRLIEDFNRVVSDTEALLRSIAGVTGDKAAALRASVEENLKATKERLQDLQDSASERTAAAARATDDYVHDNPWVAIGVAAALGLIVGLAIGGRK